MYVIFKTKKLYSLDRKLGRTVFVLQIRTVGIEVYSWNLLIFCFLRSILLLMLLMIIYCIVGSRTAEMIKGFGIIYPFAVENIFLQLMNKIYLFLVMNPIPLLIISFCCITYVLCSLAAADILLWRNKRSTAVVLGAGTALWFFFECLEYHMITLVCHLMILALGGLFLWSNASVFIHK